MTDEDNMPAESGLEKLIKDAQNLNPEDKVVRVTSTPIKARFTEEAKTDLGLLGLGKLISPLQEEIDEEMMSALNMPDSPLEFYDESETEPKVVKKERIIKSTVRSPIRKKKYVKINFKNIKSNPRKFY